MNGRWTKPNLVGKCVVLRPITVADTDAQWEAVNDPQGNDLTATTATFTYEQIRDWCSTRAAAANRLDLAIVEKATGEYAGEVVLNEYVATTESANFRVALRGPAWFGRGLGTEATRLVVAHGFDSIGLRLITLEVLERNPRAIRVYEKVGFLVTETYVEEGERWIRMNLLANHPSAAAAE